MFDDNPIERRPEVRGRLLRPTVCTRRGRGRGWLLRPNEEDVLSPARARALVFMHSSI